MNKDSSLRLPHNIIINNISILTVGTTFDRDPAGLGTVLTRKLLKLVQFHRENGKIVPNLKSFLKVALTVQVDLCLIRVLIMC